MKKRVFSLLLTLLLLASLGATAWAENGKVWHVTFTSAAKMESDFKSSAIDEAIGAMEPGDSASFTVELANKHSKTTDWYMSNKVLKTLESTGYGIISGGAYSYRLVYVSPTGAENVLFDSDKVGGEVQDAGRQGLQEATSNLEDYFYLDTLTTGQKASVKLTVTLEGETQGNDYQNTRANIQLNFAVELRDTKQAVKTGDDTNLLPLYGAMIGSGILFLILAIDSVRQRRRERRGMR
ncbi:MAG: hypothetical protein J5927_06665 [Oscillospiraceae bacterium]|nr:hypothetical protein [Oscillospiraceae bacterium]